ncbi:polymorphic toxin type 24 domain-containing protein [Rhodococcus sp. APC 3903]|uniref:polymorphic toxin type 24 domain-containing protein n=1 Tax=Rhodococcus sp. APC 3903 TaxID=3035193 RepID=UPI0025B596CA|nr:polymorphic toxin type 24 domain-containing protein [Rhodococcus sp. APC 3903]MDN3460692.1 polymorphic toxin type 24 domain-containing protein [Rhodococcus sp. APC 3903]
MTPAQIGTARMALRRSVAGVLAAGAVLTGTAGVIGAGIALTAGPASAGPAEDCAAVRARDHQIYLNLIASLPPGAPIPPEYINPCLTAPTTTSTAAPTTTVGLPGAQAPGGGPNVGANAPTNFPTYNGTPIVPVPGGALPGTPGTPPTSGVENPAGVPVPTTTSGPAPTTPQPAGSTAPTSTSDRGPGPVPAATTNTVSGHQESTPSVATPELDEDDGRDRYLELVLVGAAGFTAAGIGVRGRSGPFSPRTPESVVAGVGSASAPLVRYAPGGFEQITVPNEHGGERTLVLINDATSPRSYRFPLNVPEGGHATKNPDGSISVFDAAGREVTHYDAPWAYDATGKPVPTEYEIDGNELVQHVYPEPDSIFPILADPSWSGVLDGVKDFGAGVGTAVKDNVLGMGPLIGYGGEGGPGVKESWQGVGALVGLGGEGAPGVKDSWKNVGKETVAWDDYAGGDGAYATGKVTGNIVTAVVGSKGASAALKLGKDGAKDATEQAGRHAVDKPSTAPAPAPTLTEKLANADVYAGTGGSSRGSKFFPVEDGPKNGALVRLDEDGKVRNYAEYDENGNIVRRVDLAGNPHGTVETPHVVEVVVNRRPDGKEFPKLDNNNARPATEEEIASARAWKPESERSAAPTSSPNSTQPPKQSSGAATTGAAGYTAAAQTQNQQDSKLQGPGLESQRAHARTEFENSYTPADQSRDQQIAKTQGPGLEAQREQARANLDMVNRESDLNTVKIQGPGLEAQRDAARERLAADNYGEKTK